jgi:IstB-like ATP binding protein
VLAKAEREGALREKIRFLCRFALLIVDEIGYLPVTPGGGNLFFQLVNARYEKGAMILTSNRGFAEWGEVFGDPVVATALLDRLLHHARDQVTVSAIMRISSLSTSDQRLSFSLQRSPRNPSAAASRPRTEAPITPTADHRPAKVGNFGSPKVGRFRGPLTASRPNERGVLVLACEQSYRPPRSRSPGCGRRSGATLLPPCGPPSRSPGCGAVGRSGAAPVVLRSGPPRSRSPGCGRRSGLRCCCKPLCCCGTLLRCCGTLLRCCGTPLGCCCTPLRRCCKPLCCSCHLRKSWNSASRCSWGSFVIAGL